MTDHRCGPLMQPSFGTRGEVQGAVSDFARPKKNHQRGKSMKQNSNLNHFLQLFFVLQKPETPNPLLGSQNWVTKLGGRHYLVPGGHSLRRGPAWSVIENANLRSTCRTNFSAEQGFYARVLLAPISQNMHNDMRIFGVRGNYEIGPIYLFQRLIETGSSSIFGLYYKIRPRDRQILSVLPA